MVKYKRISIITMLVFIFSIIPSRFVQAMENINIISNTIITKEDAKEWAYKRGASEIFVGLADLYWKDYKNHGQVNPAIAYVQGALETNFGHFGGVLNESYKNPCGMKNSSGGGDFDANAHYKFSTWKEGVDAQLDHLALYAGAKGYPKNNKNTTD
ncbi:MAG: glucosaminidase domain-containing protein, partial [Sarcina sp.]